MTRLRKLGRGMWLVITNALLATQTAYANALGGRPRHGGHWHDHVTANEMNEVGFLVALVLGVGVYLLIRRRTISHE